MTNDLVKAAQEAAEIVNLKKHAPRVHVMGKSYIPELPSHAAKLLLPYANDEPTKRWLASVATGDFDETDPI